MTDKPTILRNIAAEDIADVRDHYDITSGLALASRFLQAVEAALLDIRAYPAIGSLGYADDVGESSLRRWSVKRFPYAVFYIEREDHIDVWRVLHVRRDIPSELREQ